MKHNRADNITRRMLDKSWRLRVGIILIMLIAFGLPTTHPATAQRGANQGYGKRIEIPAGLDLFKTVTGATQFMFKEEFTVPGGFFNKGSGRFAGTVTFKGVPVAYYKDLKTGSADTIVERSKGTTFDGRNARASVPIELVVLSLESAKPISVRVGKEWQQWNVKLALSSSRKSEGTMTIIRRSENGGTFNSELVVYALFTFTRKSDGAEKSLDVGAMKLTRKSIEKITLRATEAPWSVAAAGFQAGTTTSGIAATVRHKAPTDRHFIKPIYLNE